MPEQDRQGGPTCGSSGPHSSRLPHAFRRKHRCRPIWWKRSPRSAASIDPPKTNALYAPLHDGEPYPGATVIRDIKYGPDDLHALDVFKATQPAAAARPVLIHVHGGGFVRGDKHTAGTPFTDNIPLWAARNGMVGVNVNYRLAPKVTWPAGTEDMAAILRWTKANIAAHGGDPAKVFLLGWSAGAHHVVSYWRSRNSTRPTRARSPARSCCPAPLTTPRSST